MKFGDKLRGLREQANLTCGELVDKAGLTLSIYFGYEANTKCPTVRNFLRLTEALGVSMEVFRNTELPADRRELNGLRHKKIRM